MIASYWLSILRRGRGRISPPHHLRLAFLLAACLGLVSACELGADMAISQAHGAVTLTMTMVGSHRPACLSSLYVSDDTALTKPIWEYTASTEADAPCLSRVTIGPAPTGFGADPPSPLHLAPGRSYMIIARGLSWRASTDFVAAR